jgi:glucose-6-phosphate 1-dehydrogenase
MHGGELPEDFVLIGADLAEGTAETWANHLHEMLESFVGNEAAEFDVKKIDEKAWQKLAGRMRYIRGDMTKPDLYGDIGKALDQVGKNGGTAGNVIFYLAVPDRFFGTWLSNSARRS